MPVRNKAFIWEFSRFTSTGIRMRLFPEHPTLVYRPFTVNKDNYIFLTDRGRIHANLHLHDDEGTGLSFYTNREDSIASQDMTVELSRINLKEFRRILPYMPDMEGWIRSRSALYRFRSVYDGEQ